MKYLAFGIGLVLSACGDSQTIRDAPAPMPLKSGTEFLTLETQALQADTFANPAMLWVDRGQTLFTKPVDMGMGIEKACADCHSETTRPLTQSATHFPKLDEKSGALVNLEEQINLCRIRYQNTTALDYESQDLLALTAYTAHQSNGQAISVNATPKTLKNFENGKDYFFTKRGQMNFSCAQCHDENWGKKLRGDTISQGHGNGFPAYRLEWETIGSLHRRFADCDRGVRAQPLELGSETYTDLELYLAVRGNGLDIETPAIRR